MITITAEQRRPDTATSLGGERRAALEVSALIALDGAETEAVCVRLPGGGTVTLVVQSAEDAEALAAARIAARIARGRSDLLAADCKPIAHAAADALVAAGLGRG